MLQCHKPVEEIGRQPKEVQHGLIILNSGIPNLLEEINPLDNLTKQVHKYDCLSTLSGISPFPLDALLLGLFGKFEQV
jgi:hypothetical protein